MIYHHKFVITFVTHEARVDRNVMADAVTMGLAFINPDPVVEHLVVKLYDAPDNRPDPTSGYHHDMGE